MVSLTDKLFLWWRVEKAWRMVEQCLSAVEQEQVRAELMAIIEALERIIVVLRGVAERGSARA